MIPWISKAKHLGEYKIWVEFDDGAAGEIDLAMELDGEIFQPLKDISYFKNFDIIGHTLAWPNGADFAPEYIREHIT